MNSPAAFLIGVVGLIVGIIAYAVLGILAEYYGEKEYRDDEDS